MRESLPAPPPGGRHRIGVAMSGGVDSSVAAMLLVDEGYDVFGLTMVTAPTSLPVPAAASVPDPATSPVEAAAAVARRIGILHFPVDLRDEFSSLVVEPFVDAYTAGLTPNPCVLCNAGVKFGLLVQAALARGAGFLATGHYAVAEEVGLSDIGLDLGRVRLEGPGEGISPARGGDAPHRILLRRSGGPKDQTYALCLLTQEQLRRCVFPLGGLTKPQVRELALKRGLPSALRPESQDVCFLAGLDYRSYVIASSKAHSAPGPIVDRSGRVLGTHEGLLGYTVGQRRRLGLGGPDAHYVLELRPARNELVVGPEAGLYSAALSADRPSFAAFESLAGPIRVDAAVRYRSPAAPAVLTPLPGGRLEVRFDQPQRAVAPGQAVAFYVRDWLIGGATIVKAA